MSNMMIYGTTDKVGGNIESVWGHKMRVRTIDSSDEEVVKQAKADGWLSKASQVIEQIETQKLEAENEVMKGKLSSGDGNKRIKELEAEVKDLKAKLAIYEESKDVNGDGVVSYDEMEKDELKSLLDKRGVKYVSRDNLDDLIQKAKDSE
ncbi:hypothetical protein [Psychrobacter sp.]|uniref:hypothetical protein n=1 Tax=Psychrobacter sp. TaxID=56811 RepID=UPI003565A199